MHCRECKCYLLPSIDLLDKIDCRFLNPFSFEISVIKEISMTAYALTMMAISIIFVFILRKNTLRKSNSFLSRLNYKHS